MSEPSSSARPTVLPEDAVAQAIRAADGQHNLGAGRLGEIAVKALRDAGYMICVKASFSESVGRFPAEFRPEFSDE